MPRRPEQPDIVQVNVEGEKPLSLTKNGTDMPTDNEEGLLSATSLQTGSPVMEVILSGVQLRVTNEINPKLLADTIRLLRGGKC